MTDLEARLRPAVGERLLVDEPHGPRTTYRVGGRARWLLEAASVDDLRAARDAVVATGVAVLVVGRGSNLLVADAGFDGLAVALGEAFAAVDVEGTTVRAGGAASLPVVARRTVAAGLTGFEWAVGVPGSVGGAVRMNAGGHGSDTAAVLRRAWVADLGGEGTVVERTAAEFAFAYRHSNVATTEVVVSAEFAVATRDADAAGAEIDEIVRWRREHQPGGANAGSVFTNPPGDSAGRLIEAAGLKGFAIGAARVSERHANFFQAEPSATAADVVGLVLAVQRRIEEETGIRLRPELRLAAFAGMPGAHPGAPHAWQHTNGPARCPA